MNSGTLYFPCGAINAACIVHSIVCPAMARIARIVVPGLPHYIIRRGRRGEAIFAFHEDYVLYRDLLAEQCRIARVACWAYCLMPDLVHLILVPSGPGALARALGETHRRYTGLLNARARRTGHLFQSRFESVVVDEDHLIAAVRRMSLSPLRTGLVRHADEWPWSSLRAHLGGEDDELVTVRPLLDRVTDFARTVAMRPGDFNALGTGADGVAASPAAGSIGRPMGSDAFVSQIEEILGRTVRPAKRGRKPAVGA